MSDLPPQHAGRVVDPSVAEDDAPTPPVKALTQESEPTSPRPAVARPAPSPSPLADEPALRPNAYPPLPPSEVLLDPREAPPPIPEHRPKKAAPSVLSPTMTAVFGTLFGLAGLFALFAVLQRVSPHRTGAGPIASASAPAPVTSASAARPAASAAEEEEPPPTDGPWRVANLKEDDNTRIITGTIGQEALVKILGARRISTKETYRILTALKGFDAVKKPGKTDKFFVAVDKNTGRVKAFELEKTPVDIYQAREDDTGHLVGSKLDMQVATRRFAAALRITENVSDDLKGAKLHEPIASLIDKAFDGRASLSAMPKNSTLRVIVQEKTALGRFASYDYIEALEYQSSKADSKPLRVYRYRDGGRWTYFDQQGKEPHKGGWRRPVPGAPITSQFNPHRLHPILKIVKPHEGIDFGAPQGTPVHATSFGTVTWMGPRGPAGNLIIIQHPKGIESYYMHLHHYASGLKKGDKVESFQLIGYVGTTGRSTGPHLHFGIKRDGKWTDPMSLKLDGDRLISSSLRAGFESTKSEMDTFLDAVEIPPAVGDSAPPAASVEPLESSAPPVESAPPGQPPATPPSTPGSTENFDDEELEPAGALDPKDEPKHKNKK